MTIPKNIRITNDEDLNSVISQVYKCADRVLSQNFHKHFTKHDIRHSVRVLEHISSLVEKTNIRLSNEEKFVLTCAVYLHDIGMQTTKYLTDEEKVLPEKEVLKIIRDNHHEYSKLWILESIQLDLSDKFYLGLKGKEDFVNSIALVAEYHRRNANINKIEDCLYGNKSIRQKLLCSLICVGDCLDIGKDRVDIELLNTFDIEPESKFFWYSNYFVSGVLVEPKKIIVQFTFSPEYRNSKYISAMQKYILSEIDTHFRFVSDCLRSYENPSVRKDIEDKTDFSDAVVHKIPDDLKGYIENKFFPKEESKEEPKEEKYSDGGLGEIDFYWGKRMEANDTIREYLKNGNFRKIFIAAIGFGTIKNVITDSEIIDNFKESIKKESDTQFEITFVLPDTLDNLIKYRSDGDTSNSPNSNYDLYINFNEGRKNLKEFIKKLAEACYPDMTKIEQINKIIMSNHIKFKRYTEKAIPRHFILKSEENVIFVGSYLGCTEGKKSYIMKLVNKTDMPQQGDHYTPGLFDLFKREIEHIHKHCTDDTTVFDEIKKEIIEELKK